MRIAIVMSEDYPLEPEPLCACPKCSYYDYDEFCSVCGGEFWILARYRKDYIRDDEDE